LKLLEEKMNHSLVRKEMSRRWFSRLRPMSREIQRGNYAKYSYGYKSVLQDLFLR